MTFRQEPASWETEGLIQRRLIIDLVLLGGTTDDSQVCFGIQGGLLMQRILRRSRVLCMATCCAAAINSGAMAFEASLTVSGDQSVKDILSAASLTLAAKLNGVTSPQEIQAAANADYRELVSALYKSGYYSGVVNISVDGREASSLSLLRKLSEIRRVDIVVSPGKRFHFAQARIEPLAPETILPEAFTTGKIARSQTIRQATRRSIEAWRSVGRAKAKIAKQSILADHKTATLDADIAISTGPVVRFGTFIPSGNVNVRTQRVHEIAGFPDGKVFSPEALDTVAGRLRRTGVFRSVSLSEAEVLHGEDLLDISADLVEAKPRRFGFGLEVSSLDGSEISAFWMHRNLFGGAERLRFDGKISGLYGTGGVDYSVSSRFERPATLGPDVSFFTNGIIAQYDEPDYYSQQAQIAAGLSLIRSEHLSAEAGFGYRYSDDRDDFGDRIFEHFVLPLSATYDRRDSALNATNGYFASAQFMPYLGISGSANGALVSGDLRAYRQMSRSGGVVLAGRLQFGSIVGSSLNETPPNLLFYSGGGGSVRGQPYQSLNVDLGGGNSSGGRSMLIVSSEIRASISKKLALVAFVDAGFIGAESFSTDDGKWHAGSGIGIRYDTGIGPIRFDIAAPTGGDTGEGLQFYVGIGQAF